ncbi:intradiol ring-cleavage dioxygenase [Aspergillus brunneoviolaceus CBS 621.78]|uniref:Aromatic compound dioxygenase n=2 Tax=Aspergillus TaxID=5052 RepID=A0A8G1RUB9_9EURO|nr:aromatic compound dioxygenase [Aspergillus brunneoviolaceus CBS 621.78]XP_040802468.1 aromatic compound dioxygenase [Aspergillus fijiensis CBS 313.89]RAH46495.1 aromatic compound dioxygenase [Aspergillus brunneoviolaceus CBS 621.78]RAK78458.1 aromatic compound dioxygenase [Aspergillus fijiensis CBS 313.89]
MHFKNVANLAIVGGAVLATAHPGHEEKRAASELLEFKANMRRGLEKCAARFESSGLNARAEVRRRALVDSHRKRLAARDTSSVLATNHNETGNGITADSSESEIFGSSSSCVLNPEGETGPYYVPGEYVRADLRESQPGVPVTIEGQFVDVETCEPITDLYWDIWNCNATGVYSGLVATGNGNTADTSNLNATFLRGIQKTDSDGVVTFNTLFPGHYSGRTTHHHMVAHLDVTVQENNTITGGTVAHIGQIFWDQDLINAVEATSPYNENTVTLTTNAEDRVFSDETENSTSDPVLNYVYIGDDLSDGLFGWITIAVNVSATYDPNYSFIYTSSGGEAVDDSSSSTGGSSPGGGQSSGSGGPGGSGQSSGGQPGGF